MGFAPSIVILLVIVVAGFVFGAAMGRKRHHQNQRRLRQATVAAQNQDSRIFDQAGAGNVEQGANASTNAEQSSSVPLANIRPPDAARIAPEDVEVLPAYEPAPQYAPAKGSAIVPPA